MKCTWHSLYFIYIHQIIISEFNTTFIFWSKWTLNSIFNIVIIIICWQTTVDMHLLICWIRKKLVYQEVGMKKKPSKSHQDNCLQMVATLINISFFVFLKKTLRLIMFTYQKYTLLFRFLVVFELEFISLILRKYKINA